MLVLLETLPQVTDPLALILAAGSGAISLLLMIVLALVNTRMKNVDEALRKLTDTVNEMSRSVTALEVFAGTATKEIDRLREIERPPAYRTDGPSDHEMPTIPPPRPRLPSRGRHGV